MRHEVSELRIIYPIDNGGVAVIVPAPEWFEKDGNTIEALAAKDVPAGKPFKIVEAADIPTDRTFRAAWEYVE
jgi:hypothetical protein